MKRLYAVGICVVAGLLGSSIPAAAAPRPSLLPTGTAPTVQLSSASVSAIESAGTQAPAIRLAPGPLPLPAGSQISLKQAIAIALKYHPRIAEASANVNAAEQRVGEARSFLGPQLYGLGEYLRTTENGIGNTSYYNVDGILPRITGTNHSLPGGELSQSWSTSSNYVGGLALSQYLLDFGRRRGFVAQQRFEAAASRAERQMVELNLIFEVSQRYFNVLQAKQLVRVYEQAVEQRRYHLHEAQVKASAGLRPQLDVYLTRAEVERAELHLVDARNAEADALVGFDNSLGLGGMSPAYRLVDVLAYHAIKLNLASLLGQAIRQRPDLRALQDQARAMGAQVREYRSDDLPTVNALAGYNAMGTGLPAVNNFNVGIVVSWPLFNSFLTTHQVAEARFRQQAIESQIEDLRQHVMWQVKTALLDWRASLERIIRAQRARAASSAELELAEKRYQAGLADIVELEDAQRNYTDDDAAYTNALYGFSVAKAALDQATGRALNES